MKKIILFVLCLTGTPLIGADLAQNLSQLSMRLKALDEKLEKKGYKFLKIVYPERPRLAGLVVRVGTRNNPINDTFLRNLIELYNIIASKYSETFMNKSEDLLTLINDFEMQDPGEFKAMVRLIKTIGNDINTMKKQCDYILQLKDKIKIADAREATQLIATMRTQLAQFTAYCNQLDFLFSQDPLAEVKFNGKYLKQKFKNKVMNRIEPLKELLREIFPRVTEHIKKLGSIDEKATFGMQQEPENKESNPTKDRTNKIYDPDLKSPELEEKVKKVRAAYADVQKDMERVEAALRVFLDDVKAKNSQSASGSFGSLMYFYTVGINDAILEFEEILKDNLNDVSIQDANSRVEVYKFLKSIRKDFKYFVRDINKKIDASFGDLESILLSYNNEENSAWAFVLKYVIGRGPLRMLKPANHRISPRKGGGYQREPWSDTFADEFKKITTKWLPKIW